MAPSVDLHVIKAVHEFNQAFLEVHSRKEMKNLASLLLEELKLQTKNLKDVLKAPGGGGNVGNKKQRTGHPRMEKDTTDEGETSSTKWVLSKRRRECPRTPGRDGNCHGLMKTSTSGGRNKVWKCYCSLEFISNAKFKSHFVIKTQPERLSCPACPKRFHLCPQLRAHCKRVHKLDVYGCSMCYAQFTTENAYKNHLSMSLFET